MSKPTSVETHAFQTEVQQLLQLIIHSLYSNKEIFLREMISNASDACDRVRFASLTEKGLLEENEALGIEIELNKKKRTITVRDNGIGMNRDEVIENIGTIAHSGTRQFLEQLTGDQAKDTSLIGQFGVGFYSAFLVAEKVDLLTRKAGEPAESGVHWNSDGSGEYTIETVERPQRGTEITLTLRKEDKEFLDSFRLRSIISRYSDHVSLPIRMIKEPVSDEEKEKAKQEGPEWETVNKGSALWARPRNEITEEDYNSFYSTLSYDPEPPLAVLHNRVEGKLEYISLFFIPGKAPFDLYDREQRHGIKLYVRRIFIADDAKHLMPNYLRFMRGLVDSADLPLNVSREFLQHNREIDKIRAASVKKVLAQLKKMAGKDPEKYAKFWKAFGPALKEGIIEDMDNRDAIAKLLRFATSNSEGEAQTVSLDDYTNRMPVKQKAIYYITADGHAAAASSPLLEIFRKNDTEVLLLSDPVDEWLVNHLHEYEGKELKSVAKGALDLEPDADEKKDKDAEKKNFEPLLEKIRQALGEQVKEVRLSSRLVDSPSCLVADEHDIGANMERILQAMGQEAPDSKPILELNPDHSIIAGIDPESDAAPEWAQVLLDQAALAEGITLKDPAGYVKRVNKLLAEAG